MLTDDTIADPSNVNFENEVAQAAEWLDETHEGWHHKVDPDILDLYSTCDCVLGQLHGRYCNAPEEITKECPHAFGQLIHGYEPEDTDLSDNMVDELNTRIQARMEKAWKREIASRS